MPEMVNISIESGTAKMGRWPLRSNLHRPTRMAAPLSVNYLKRPRPRSSAALIATGVGSPNAEISRSAINKVAVNESLRYPPAEGGGFPCEFSRSEEHTSELQSPCNIV